MAHIKHRSLIHDTQNQQNAQTYSLDTHNITIILNVSVRKVPLSENQAKPIQHKTKLVTFVHS